MADNSESTVQTSDSSHALWVAMAVMVTVLVLAPTVVYPVFLMKVMCFVLFA